MFLYFFYLRMRHEWFVVVVMVSYSAATVDYIFSVTETGIVNGC